MLYDAIDHVILPVADLDVAAQPFRRLGLTLFPGARHQGQGTQNTGFFVGSRGGTAGGSTGEPERSFYVELLGVVDAAEAGAVHGEGFAAAALQGRGLSAVCLRTEDLAGAVARLREHGLSPAQREVRDSDGRLICTVAEVRGPAEAAADIRLIQYHPSHAARHERRAAAGLLDQGFPLKRLDHLAAVAPDIEASTRYWTDVLGVPVAGEVATATMIIRQMKIGDAIFELLGPASPESPIAKRPPGLASMCAFEVPDLAAAVEQARVAGFTCPDPGPGALPGTRVATIPAAELSGMGLQLLEYV
jgi:catechol 2,3-dioxygenase-like lactoylglutathione lyase family enzyme